MKTVKKSAKATPETPAIVREKVLVLRTCDKNGKSRGGFQWPEAGAVSDPCWRPEPCCGYGLHGLLWGLGDATLLNWSDDAVWIVYEAWADEVVSIHDGQKVKVPACVVVYFGDRKGATDYLNERKPGAIPGLQLSSGDGATLTGGYRATLTGGDGATLTGGDGATLTGGYRATLTGGNGATLTGGDGATLVLRWFDGKRYRIADFMVGEDGIEPNVAYRLDGAGKIQKVVQP